jgi:hypothetical protein
MTSVDAPRRFRVGDRVRVHGSGGGQTVWTVTSDDTGKTPVHDPEPAYGLETVACARKATRYAYESDLVLAGPADTR